MILVTGASGNVGGELVDALVARDEPVRVLVRNADSAVFPSPVDLAVADLRVPDAVAAALGRHPQAVLAGWRSRRCDLLQRVRDAGVEHVVLLTSRCVVGGEPDNAITRMWLDAEAVVRDAGVPWTVLRPSGFHSNVLRWLPQLRHGDVVRAPWPDVPIASIDPADIAAVAATVLTQRGHEQHERPR